MLEHSFFFFFFFSYIFGGPIWLPLFSFFSLYNVKAQQRLHPSSIRCRGSNSQPLDHESSALTTRPWLLAREFFLSIFTFELLSKYYRGFLSERLPARLSQHIIKMYLLCLPYSLFYSEHQARFSFTFPSLDENKNLFAFVAVFGNIAAKIQFFVSSLFLHLLNQNFKLLRFAGKSV